MVTKLTIRSLIKGMRGNERKITQLATLCKMVIVRFYRKREHYIFVELDFLKVNGGQQNAATQNCFSIQLVMIRLDRILTC